MAHLSSALLTLTLCVAAVSARKGAIPETTIVEQPADVLVTEGSEAVLKCKTSGDAARCKWLLNRTDNPYELVDVKDFRPKRNGDCSIRIKQVKPTHVGRWVCSVTISLLHEQLVSRPARVAIATLAPRSRVAAIVARPVNTSVLQGQAVDLDCRTESEVKSCGWAMPDDVVITLSRNTMSLLDDVMLSFRGDLARGDCGIRVDAMEARFAGDWSCFFERDGQTVWTAPGHLQMVPAAQARTGSVLASTSPVVVVALVLAIVAVAAGVFGAAIYRRRSQLHHDKLQENPLYGIKNLQLAAAASAAQRKEREAELSAPATGSLEELSSARRAPPNDYYTKDGAGVESGEHTYTHVYDTPRKSAVYDVPSSRQAYQVPRSSYEIPPTPVKVGGDNVYEEVRPVLFRDDDMDGYLIPKEKLKL